MYDEHVVKYVKKKFQSFAKMATLMDAYAGYCEKVAYIQQFQFIETPHIFQRYKQLFYNVLHLLSLHNIKPHQLQWYKTNIGPFKLGERHILITTKPTIIANQTLLIDVIHKPKITYEDHLRALLSAQIEANENMNVYVINIATGMMEQSKLNPRNNASLYFIGCAVNGKLFEEKNHA